MKRRSGYAAILFFFCLLAVVACYLVSRSRTFQFFGEIVSEVRTDKKVVALTFDDGPAGNTDTILQILERYHVKATFFLTGREMTDHPELTRLILASGHTIGNHSYSHERMMLKSPAFIRNEVEMTDSIIRSHGFLGKIYFRPPYCKKLFYLPYYLSCTGRTTITWNVEPDSDHNEANVILEDVKGNVGPGSIILLHAMYPNRKASLEALPAIIEWLQQNGYALLTVDELLERS